MGCESKAQKLEKFLLKGNLTLKDEDRERALYYYEQALDIDPCFVHALNNIGTIYYQARDFAKAIDYYDKALNCDPLFFNGFFNRANALYDNKEYYRAIEDINKIIFAKPDTGRAHFVKGLILTGLKNYPQAYASFADAIRLDSTLEAEALVNMAVIKYYQKDFDSAEIQLQRSMKINRSEGNIYNMLALINIEKGNYDQAMRYVNQALSFNKNGWYLNNRGYIYLKQGNLEKAEADINESITIDPYNAWAYRNKGILLFEKKELTTAERLLNRAKDLDPTIDLLNYYFGEVYTAQGRNTEACKAFGLEAANGNVKAIERVKRCS